MRRLRMQVEYDGTDFSGWQRQANGPTIQATLEDVIAQMTPRQPPPSVRGAGRTDAGVHALGQVAHFDTESTIPIVGFRRGMNALLPRTIAVVSLEEAAPDFDARFSASGKLYRYQIWNADSRSPIRDRFVWHQPRRLDAIAMQAAARPLIGRHDFNAFRAADCERKTTVRQISRLDVKREGDLIGIEVEADAFLKNMVRILVGTLTVAGFNKLDARGIERLLASRDRTQGGPTAPPQGLTLVRVDYER